MPYFHAMTGGSVNFARVFETILEAVDAAAPDVVAVVKVDDVEEVRTFPRRLTEDQRHVLMEFIDLDAFVASGCDPDEVVRDFHNMTDDDFVHYGFECFNSIEEREAVIERIRDKNPAVADVLFGLVGED